MGLQACWSASPGLSQWKVWAGHLTLPVILWSIRRKASQGYIPYCCGANFFVLLQKNFSACSDLVLSFLAVSFFPSNF